MDDELKSDPLMRAGRPHLVLNFDPRLDLKITLASESSQGGFVAPEYRFAIDCQLRHLSGSFSYSATDLCFEPESFARFSRELEHLQRGLSQRAALSNVGGMMVFVVEGNSRSLRAHLEVREYVAPSTAMLKATLDVDYDLFVNKLRVEVDRFTAELKRAHLREQDC
jgi:hypothetical protein